MSEIETLEITYEGKERELKMTHGLKRRLSGLIPTPEAAISMTLDFEMSDTIVMEVLRPRTEDGTPDPAFNAEVFQKMIDNDGLNSEDYEAILFWVQRAIIDFFLNRMQSTLETEDRLRTTHPKLVAKISQLGPTG